jgi:hypothetical protein
MGNKKTGGAKKQPFRLPYFKIGSSNIHPFEVKNGI